MSEELEAIYKKGWNAAKYGQKDLHGIDAIIQHRLAETLAAHVAECHAKPAIEWTAEKVAAFNALTAGDVKAMGQPEAGDWAMEEAKRQWTTMGCFVDLESVARGYRDAAERHYGAMIDALKEAATTAIQERDAARAEGTVQQ